MPIPNPRPIPQWLTGEGLTDLYVQTAQRDRLGVWSPGPSTSALVLSIDRIELVEDIDLVDIRPVNRRQKNMVITGDGWGLNLVEILKQDANFPNLLVEMVALSDFYYIAFARGLEFFEGYFTRGAYRDGVTDFGKNTAELQVHPLDVGFPSNVAFGFLS